MRVAPTLTLATGLALCACLTGCGGGDLERLRRVTYPPDFHYITQQEIRTTMGRLAVEVAALEAIMEKEGGPQSEDRPAVVASLERMDDLAAQLKQGARSNHPRIDADAPQLRADIERALLVARTGSTNYYDVGRVVGACMYCHSPRDAPAHPDPKRDPSTEHEPDPNPNRYPQPNPY